jgi:hypothetical protein
MAATHTVPVLRLRVAGAAFWLAVLAAPLAAAPYYPPLSAHIDTDALPQDFLTPAEEGGPSLAERVRVKSFLYSELSVMEPGGETRDIGARITTELVVTEGFELKIPGLEEAFTIVLLEGSFTAQVTAREEETEDPASPENFPFIAELTAPSFPAVLRLNEAMFKPVQPGTFEPFPAGMEPHPEISLAGVTTLTFRVTWDGETDVAFSVGAGPPVFTLSTPVMLGDSGIVLEMQEVALDLSEMTSPPGIADPAWRGVKIGRFAVHWTNGLEVPDSMVEDDGAGNLSGSGVPGVVFTDFSIGTGGFSGSMCGTGLGLDLAGGLFDMDFTVDELCVAFTRNSLTGGKVVGTASSFPFFDAGVELTLALEMSGNFTIGLADPDPMDGEAFIVWTVPDVLNFYVDSVAFERRDEVFLVRLNGAIEPLFFAELDGVSAADSDGSPASGEAARIAVNGLTLTSEGDVSIDGGWITLPEKKYIDFKAFKITLSQVGFGRTEGTTAQSWFGFTGGVQLVEGLDAEAEVKRLQFLWPGTGGDPVDVKLEGIAVAFHQPGVLRFEGAVDWFETTAAEGVPGTEGFAGKLEIALIALNNMTIAGRVVIGSATRPAGGDFKFFYIDLETQFPAGIPVFSGISLYGLSGLFAYNMRPNISAFTTPVQWFNGYRAAENVIAGSPPPWVVQDRALALGAGVIFGTSDEGYTVNAKVALTISVPGPVVVLEGSANILKPRAQLSDSSDVPDFVALAVYDGTASTFLVNIGCFYELVEVIEVSGEAEAFFNLADPGDWHLYLGQRDPEDRRITATVLALAQASSYYMIEPSGLAFGAKLSYGDSWKFGPLRVRLEAWFAYDADISWRPIQVWGQIDLGGAVELKAFGVGVGLSAQALLELETPQPFTIEGEFKVKLSLPWPLPDPKATVHLAWRHEGEQRPLDEAVTAITLHTRKGELVLRPGLEGFSGDGGAGVPSALVSLATLCPPGDSVPRAGSLEVDVRPEEPQPNCGRPLVPLDSFVSVRFDRSMNDPSNPPAGIGLGNAYATDPANRHRDVVDEKTFQYDADAYELLYHPKDAATVTVDTAPAGLYASWTSIPATAAEESHNNLDVLSKNPFRYYDNATYLGYEGNQVEWTDWAAGHYGAGYCLDGFTNNTDGIWERYHWSDGAGSPLTGTTTTTPAGQTTHQPPRCPIELDWMEEEDFVLPPYSVFRFVMDGRVRESDDSQTYRHYRNAVYFHTEGPPLELRDYVQRTVPEFPGRPHYRGYDVAIRFDENYMNKLYRESADQFLQLQVLDVNERPVPAPGGGESLVVTDWDEAPDTELSPTEAAWVEVLQALGILTPASLPKDDLVFGRVADATAVRPGQRHLVRVQLEDPRLEADQRLTDAGWLAANPVRWVSPDRRRAVLYEFDYTASRYESLAALVSTFAESGGTWFRQPVDAALDLADLGALVEPLDEDFADGAVAVGNSDTDRIGVFLRHLLAPRPPEELSAEGFLAHAGRTPGYAGDAATLSDAQRQAIGERWNAALAAFAAVDDLLGLELERQPLPEQMEVSVLSRGGEAIGYLVELPEAIDLSRVEIQAEADGVAYRPTVVPSPDDTRLFVFQRTSGGVAALPDGLHRLTLRFHRELGDRNPRYYHRDGLTTEEAVLEFSVPEDEFTGEVEP